MGFLDTLSDLNRQNFGGGLASYGKAISDLADNQYLVKGVNEFKEKKRLFENEQLKTTTEQLSEANSNIDANGDNSLIRQAVKNSLNLVETYDKIGAYQNLYQPFITSFATLGEDGVKVAATLSQELGDKVANIERKSLAPMKELEYEQMKLDWSGKDLQLRIASSNEKTKRDISKVAQYMMDNDLMTTIPGGKVTSYIRSDWVKYNSSRKAIIDDAKSHFQGMELSDNVLGPAFELAQQYLGNEFHFINKPEDNTINMGLQYEMTAMPNDLSYMQQMTAKWNGYSPETRALFRTYSKSPEQAQYNKDINPNIAKQIAEMQEIFGENGLYQNAYLRVKGHLASKGFNFDKYTKKTYEVGTDPKTKDAQYESGTFVEMYKDIIRPYGPSGFVNESFLYNPATTERIKNKLELQIQKSKNGNMFEGTPNDIFSNFSKSLGREAFIINKVE